jgi:hypothetical protein
MEKEKVSKEREQEGGLLTVSTSPCLHESERKPQQPHGGKERYPIQYGKKRVPVYRQKVARELPLRDPPEPKYFFSSCPDLNYSL